MNNIRDTQCYTVIYKLLRYLYSYSFFWVVLFFKYLYYKTYNIIDTIGDRSAERPNTIFFTIDSERVGLLQQSGSKIPSGVIFLRSWHIPGSIYYIMCVSVCMFIGYNLKWYFCPVTHAYTMLIIWWLI